MCKCNVLLLLLVGYPIFRLIDNTSSGKGAADFSMLGAAHLVGLGHRG